MAIKLGIDNTPNCFHICNMKILAINIFQPIREHFNTPIYISSGYRIQALNTALKGAKGSHHIIGQAIDIDQDGHASNVSNKDVFEYIKDNLQFTQLIYEYSKNNNPSWVHVSFDSKNLKNQVLESIRIKGRTKYINYETK